MLSIGDVLTDFLPDALLASEEDEGEELQTDLGPTLVLDNSSVGRTGSSLNGSPPPVLQPNEEVSTGNPQNTSCRLLRLQLADEKIHAYA